MGRNYILTMVVYWFGKFVANVDYNGRLGR